MSDFFSSVFGEAKEENIQFDTFKEDFWSYNYKSKQDAFWTGYFTTEPDMKMKIGEYGDFVQTVTQVMNSYPISLNSDHKQLMEM